MPEAYAYHVGDLVHAGSVGGPRPAIINSIQGKDVIIRYIAKSRGLALLKQAELTPNKDFDWCGGIALDSLQEGSAVEGRYLHGEGGKKWFRGKIAAINSNGTFAISYNDGDYEASVWRQNIRTKADRDRPNPQLAQLKGKRMNQSFASSLSPAHRDSESPKQTTKPAQAEPAEATGDKSEGRGAQQAAAGYVRASIGDGGTGVRRAVTAEDYLQNLQQQQNLMDSERTSTLSALLVEETCEQVLSCFAAAGDHGGWNANEQRFDGIPDWGAVEARLEALVARRAEATRKQAQQSRAAETRVAVKEEPVEEYDGSYACLICGESVRGMEALKCSHWQCESNPLHRACITNPKWLQECPSCKRQTMKPWSGAGGRHAAAVATIDLTTGGGKGRSDAQDPQGAASEPMRERGQGGETGARQKRVARTSSAAAMVASGDVTDTGKGGGARGRLVAPAEGTQASPVPALEMWKGASMQQLKDLLDFAALVRCAGVSTQWRAGARGAMKARYVQKHGCYKNKTLDDIHAENRQEGVIEWLYMTRPTREEVMRLGGAGFSAIRRLPFFHFSKEEIVGSLLGRAALCGKPGEALNCDAPGSHGVYVDDGRIKDAEELFEDSEGFFQVMMRDCRCTKCAGCIYEQWMNGPDEEAGDVFKCYECERVLMDGTGWIMDEDDEELVDSMREGLQERAGDRKDNFVRVVPANRLWLQRGIYEDDAAWANPSYRKRGGAAAARKKPAPKKKAAGKKK